MSREILVQSQLPNEFVVGIPEEINQVVNLDPEALIDSIFADALNSPFLLRGTGFSMAKQIETWARGYYSALIQNDNLEEFRHQLISKTVSDVVGFYYEYLSGQDVFPINVEIKTRESQKIIWAEDYRQELKTLARKEERDGALSEGVGRAVEIITESDENTIVMLNSPPGRSGLIQEGREIIFPDHQTYVYWINSEGNLEGLTLRTDIDLNDSERTLGIENSSATEWNRIKEVVSHPLSFDSDNVESVLDLIEAATGRTFEKQRNELRNREELFRLNGQAKKIVDDLRSYLAENIIDLDRSNIRLYVEHVGKAILDLGSLTLNTNEDKNSQVIIYGDFRVQSPNYTQIAAIIATIPGCNGGGTKNVDINEALAKYMQKSSSATETSHTCSQCGDRLECGYCKSCKKIMKRIA